MIFGIAALAAGVPAWLALVAVLVAWHTREVLATIGTGMAALYLLELLFPT